MEIRPLFIAAVLTISASVAQGQTTTEDGVAAFIRGDYQRAVEILKPIANGPLGADPVAAFFMGIMYENGDGVPRDPMRACALYMWSAANGPFGQQASDLLRNLQRSMRTEDYEDCMLLANVGLNSRFRAVTFVLEPGHWLALDLRGAVVTYQGKEKRTDIGLAVSNVVYHSIEHTELAAGRLGRRHFIEIFIWFPADRESWNLVWHVYEVVREEIAGVAAEELMTLHTAEPPDEASIDVRQLARLRVNDAGEAEWAVLTEPNSRSQVIETEAERQEVREQRRAREAAEARVDWKRVRDRYRTPTLAYSDAAGCSNVFVYGWSEDRTEAITVRAARDPLRLSTTPQTFDIASYSADLELMLYLFEQPIRSWPFCTDVGHGGPKETWRAIAGVVTIELSPPGTRAREPYLYRATIRIDRAEFVNASGLRIKQARPIMISAMVGSGL